MLSSVKRIKISLVLAIYTHNSLTVCYLKTLFKDVKYIAISPIPIGEIAIFAIY